MKKILGDIIILHKCARDMACDTCNLYFSFWAIFLPFYSPPPTVWKTKSKKMKKKPGDIILHMCPKNYDHMIYGSWDMLYI